MIGSGGWSLLEALAEATMKYGRADPPARVAEEIAQDAGLAVVGQPDTRMALAVRELAGLCESGYVQRVKGADPDERIAYRLTVRGARALWERDMEKVVREHEQAVAAARRAREAAVAASRATQDELGVLEEWASSWWRRVFTRMPR